MSSSLRNSLPFSLSQISPNSKNYAKYRLQDVIQSVRCAVLHHKHNDTQWKIRLHAAKVIVGRYKPAGPSALITAEPRGWSVRVGVGMGGNLERPLNIPKSEGLWASEPPRTHVAAQAEAEWIPSHTLPAFFSNSSKATDFHSLLRFLLAQRKKLAYTGFVHARHCAGHTHDVPKLHNHSGRWVSLPAAGAWAMELDRNEFEVPVSRSLCKIDVQWTNAGWIEK